MSLFITGSFYTYNVNALIPTAKLRSLRKEEFISGLPIKACQNSVIHKYIVRSRTWRAFLYRDPLRFSIFSPCVIKRARSLSKAKRRLPHISNSLFLSLSLFSLTLSTELPSRIAYLIRVCVWSWCRILPVPQWIQSRHI